MMGFCIFNAQLEPSPVGTPYRMTGDADFTCGVLLVVTADPGVVNAAVCLGELRRNNLGVVGGSL
jgi:hypothetical protein